LALPWGVVWVTGASTGIGAEICRQLAADGVKVAASARGADALQALGPGVTAFPLDVTKPDDVARTFSDIESRLGAVDLIIAGAGTYTPASAADFRVEMFERMYEVNYLGVIHVLAAALPVFRARRKGHLSWIASVAGYRGLPKAAAYGPTKAALINLAESLKPELERDGVQVSVINPGFVRTPMTAQNDFDMPFLMEPADAARATIAGLAKGRFEVAYPRPFVAILKTARVLPYWLFFWFSRRFLLK
jgi:NAD(P)-dependent dehydrogenase (short-subunit alcohol dehydrogenase family)